MALYKCRLGRSGSFFSRDHSVYIKDLKFNVNHFEISSFQKPLFCKGFSLYLPKVGIAKNVVLNTE